MTRVSEIKLQLLVPRYLYSVVTGAELKDVGVIRTCTLLLLLLLLELPLV